jgi:hypothetical protein
MTATVPPEQPTTPAEAPRFYAGQWEGFGPLSTKEATE